MDWPHIEQCQTGPLRWHSAKSELTYRLYAPRIADEISCWDSGVRWGWLSKADPPLLLASSAPRLCSISVAPAACAHVSASVCMSDDGGAGDNSGDVVTVSIASCFLLVSLLPASRAVHWSSVYHCYQNWISRYIGSLWSMVYRK